ncbi:MAG: DUF1963 domain-containing protein [Thermoguttaceae bacterium]|nr:DUF1963 domain-containing protein [Thermoguttaceae bacterium]
MDLEAIFKNLRRNSVALKSLNSEEPIPTNASKFGGLPCLPPDWEWPCWVEDRYIPHPLSGWPEWLKKLIKPFCDVSGKFVRGRKLPAVFLAQINLREAAPYDVEGLLPKSGMLYFFTVAEQPCEINYWKEPNWFVKYYDGPEDVLTPREPPEETENYDDYVDAVLSENRIEFASQPSVPDLEELPYHDPTFDEETLWRADLKTREQMSALRQRCCGSSKEESDIYFLYRSFMLGYADLIQPCPPIGSLAKGALGYYGKLTEEQEKEVLEECQRWVLLLQLGPWDGIQMGDDGFLYFYIRKEDLKQKNFDVVCATADCF